MRLSIRLASAALVLAGVAPLHALRAQYAQHAQHAQMSAPSDSTPAAVSRDTAIVATVTPRTAESPKGPALTGLRAGVHLAETARAARPNAMATSAHLGQAKAMIVVGAAALITGAIIGGDPGTIIMVGGAVVGLYGLYQYLQ
jgi:hypothetical protein